MPYKIPLPPLMGYWTLVLRIPSLLGILFTVGTFFLYYLYIYIYIYNRNLWSCHNFPHHYYFLNFAFLFGFLPINLQTLNVRRLCSWILLSPTMDFFLFPLFDKIWIMLPQTLNLTHKCPLSPSTSFQQWISDFTVLAWIICNHPCLLPMDT